VGLFSFRGADASGKQGELGNRAAPLRAAHQWNADALLEHATSHGAQRACRQTQLSSESLRDPIAPGVPPAYDIRECDLVLEMWARAFSLTIAKAGAKRLHMAHERWPEAQARFETTFGPRRAAELRKVLWAVVASEFRPPVG
jgi:hypothetical protein